MGQHKPILVVGAGGAWGAGVVQTWLDRCLGPVRVLVRSIARTRRRHPEAAWLEQVEWREGDPSDIEVLLEAVVGCGILVQAARAAPILRTRLQTDLDARAYAAACAEGARLVIWDDTVGFASELTPVIEESTPADPFDERGAARNQWLSRVRDSAGVGAPVLVVRSGEPFGPGVRSGWTTRVFNAARAHQPIAVPGDPHAPFTAAYVPDLVRLTVDLLDRPAQPLNPVEVVHLAGPQFESRWAFACQVAAACQQPDRLVRSVPWWLMAALGLIDPEAQVYYAQRRAIDRPVRLDDPRRRELLPDFQLTPVTEAIDRTLQAGEPIL
ncbi:NAD-dependent epimerase/dehydratase [Isosphaera pallida ATCC 43644]|uniref:NAD-dependent epimerase/dehydratase n=1 Tax=Isosphaera pallida (strain ATCC 43644 / DSM 9630 / IS1B) TaxID=575540 RepID=E8R4S5_ISOPI|nr:NAD-dependent epimerase/dehydratase family protein [Isosphaera pallida]ADV61671.1 NAD-dependent epimerase/dehydratase [Isosphaera pallida ATCC 43644]